MLRPIFLCSTAVLLALLTGCWEGISRHVLATVLSVRGEATVQPNERGNVQALTADSLFGGGSVLRTSPGATLDLMLVPGILLRLFENSELKVEELLLVKDGNETAGGMLSRTARVRLVRGRLIAYFLAADDETQGQLIISTDRVKLTANPATLMRVDTDQNSTRVVSALGIIYPSRVGEAQAASSPNRGSASSSGTESERPAIQKGFFQAWPSTPHAIPAAEDSQAQTELAETVQIGEELLNEREQNLPRANRFPR
jgi:hypothetical protein